MTTQGRYPAHMHRAYGLWLCVVCLFGFVGMAPLPVAASNAPVAYGVAVFSGGHFWYLQPAFDGVEGVVSSRAGYVGGDTPNPNYAEVREGFSGYRLAVEVVYDPARTNYANLLRIYWRSIDPTDHSGQFCHRGPAFTPALFYETEAQRAAIDDALATLPNDVRPSYFPVLPLVNFTEAEADVQSYHRKNPLRYAFMRFRCGVDSRLNALWR